MWMHVSSWTPCVRGRVGRFVDAQVAGSASAWVSGCLSAKVCRCVHQKRETTAGHKRPKTQVASGEKNRSQATPRAGYRFSRVVVKKTNRKPGPLENDTPTSHESNGFADSPRVASGVVPDPQVSPKSLKVDGIGMRPRHYELDRLSIPQGGPGGFVGRLHGLF